jgi:hypothetical protein
MISAFAYKCIALFSKTTGFLKKKQQKNLESNLKAVPLRSQNNKGHFVMFKKMLYV